MVSVTFFLDTSLAGKNDDLDKSINYADAAWKIKEFLEKNTYKLLETAAEKLAEELLRRYPLAEKVEIEIKKFQEGKYNSDKIIVATLPIRVLESAFIRENPNTNKKI